MISPLIEGGRASRSSRVGALRAGSTLPEPSTPSAGTAGASLGEESDSVAATEAQKDAPSRLARRLGTFDAVVIGLGSMIGAGVFAAFAPAARAAGNALLLGLVLAALVAYCNATSSAELAAVYPESGGAYVYGRKRLGAVWGLLA